MWKDLLNRLSPSLQKCLSASVLRSSSPRMLSLVYFSFDLLPKFFPGMVIATPFTSVVLLEPTKLPQSPRACNQRLSLTIFFALPFIYKLPTGYLLEATANRTEQTLFVQIDSQYPSLQVDNVCPKPPFHCSDVAGIFDDTQPDGANALQKNSTNHARSRPSA
jgi:hypothetical protein